MIPAERRYDIDWLRVIAIGLLLIYHMAVGFQPWGVFIGFIQNMESLDGLWILMSSINIWRIPLLFFVSGMGVCFAMRNRNWNELITERSLRILLPFIFGTLFIVPIHVFLWQDYYHQPHTYMLNPAHLWFLGNLFIYVLILSPLFFYFKHNTGGRLYRWMKRVLSTPVALIVVAIPFVIEAVIVNPENFEMYAMTSHGFWIGALAFFFGFLFMYSGDSYTKMAIKWKWLFLVVALALYLIRTLAFNLKSPVYLMSIESTFWVFAILGIGFTYLNRPSKALSYWSKAVYPIYIVHMVFIYLASWIMFPLGVHVLVKFISTLIITMVGSIACYELVIKRVRFLRPLFGLKNLKQPLTKVSRLGDEAKI